MTRRERLYSLDVLRGLDMVLLTIVGPIVTAIQTGWGCFPEWFVGQFHHGWECFALWDIIMPLFIFACGAAVPFALEPRLGTCRSRFWTHVILRVVLLWFLGGCLQGQWASFSVIKFGPFANTLQAIAIGYLVVALTLSFRRQWLMFAVPLTLAVAYAGILADFGEYEPYSNAAFKVEQTILRWLLPAGNVYVATPGHEQVVHSYTWILTSCMFAAMTFCGYHSAKIVLTDRSAKWKMIALICYGLALLGSGCVAEIWIPCIKPIYTFSFSAQAMGWCVLSMALLYFVCDVLKLRRGLWLLLLYGQCALTVYFISGFFRKALLEIAHACGDGFASHLPESCRPLLFQLLIIVAVAVAASVRRRLRRA